MGLAQNGKTMRVAIIHDYLNQYGGAERVLEALHELYPEAPIYTSLYDPEAMPDSYRGWDIRTSWMQQLPLSYDDGLRLFVHACVDVRLPLGQQPAAVLLSGREPYLSNCDIVPCGRFIVHGHTSLRARNPEITKYRANLDTGAVYGWPLTAAVFDEKRPEPIDILFDRNSKIGEFFRFIEFLHSKLQSKSEPPFPCPQKMPNIRTLFRSSK
jgi:hypothetical protein